MILADHQAIVDRLARAPTATSGRVFNESPTIGKTMGTIVTTIFDVDKAIDEIIGIEGRYSNNPNDAGGETMLGITEAVARAFGYRGPMMLMPRQIAVGIYKARYWLQPKFDQVATISEPIAMELFDTGVNMGVGVAGQFLQRALNAFNLRGKLWPDLTVDGAIGKMSLYALRKYLAHRGKEGERVMLSALNALQGGFYFEISEANQKNEDFVYGWIKNRVMV